MDKPPMEWIDKLFDCLGLFYGERFTSQFQKPKIADLYKTMWQSALYGYTYDEIRDLLVYLKQIAKIRNAKAPNHLEFHASLVGRRKACRV